MIVGVSRRVIGDKKLLDFVSDESYLRGSRDPPFCDIYAAAMALSIASTWESSWELRRSIRTCTLNRIFSKSVDLTVFRAPNLIKVSLWQEEGLSKNYWSAIFDCKGSLKRRFKSYLIEVDASERRLGKALKACSEPGWCRREATLEACSGE